METGLRLGKPCGVGRKPGAWAPACPVPEPRQRVSELHSTSSCWIDEQLFWSDCLWAPNEPGRAPQKGLGWHQGQAMPGGPSYVSHPRELRSPLITEPQ